MTARWQVTPLSVKDADDSYVTTISEAVTPYALILDAEESITSATAELFRIKHDYELTGAIAEPWEPVAAGENSLTGTLINTAASFAVTGHVRHETYVLVVTFVAVEGEPFTRTRILECVA